MRLFQAALDTPLDSPFSANLSVHGLHFTVCAPSSIPPPFRGVSHNYVDVLKACGGGGVPALYDASRCTRCEGYSSIAFGDAQVDLALAAQRRKGLLPS